MYYYDNNTDSVQGEKLYIRNNKSQTIETDDSHKLY